jgi:hypothetical protein
MNITKKHFILLFAFLAMQMAAAHIQSQTTKSNSFKDDEKQELILDSIENLESIELLLQYEGGVITHRSGLSIMSDSNYKYIEYALENGVFPPVLRGYYTIVNENYHKFKGLLLKSNFSYTDSASYSPDKILYVSIFENGKKIAYYSIELNKYYDIIDDILKQALSPEECEGIIKLISRKEPY